ncbi:MAG: ISKra4 family transposase [bacterium]|nr:ISKra4 family transposase [bacterium]
MQHVKVSANIKNKTENFVTIELKIPLIKSMLSGEEVILQGINAAGVLATQELLKNFDTDGSKLEVASLKMSSKGQVSKEYQTPYGPVEIKRHVYQSSKGGATFCPLENNARIVGSTTPRLAKMISNKYSRMSVDEVKTDMSGNHGRNISRDYIQKLSESVGSIALAKEELWSYSTPKLDDPVKAISIGLDGTTILMREEGYRQSMVGTIALYNRSGERLHTTYVASTPEYGKKAFIDKMTNEISKVKEFYPKANYIGVADGAKDNWIFLEKHTTMQVTDFFHATEYLGLVAEVFFKKKDSLKRKEWLDNGCHELKHTFGAAKKQLNELKKMHKNFSGTKDQEEKINRAISYFTSQLDRMNYSDIHSKNLPIGSGVTEAACKTIIKQRLCRSGMKWKEQGAKIVLSLRCLDQSNKWDQFWQKVDKFGVPAAA